MGTLAKEYLRKMQGFSTRSEIEKDVEDSVAQVNLTGKPSASVKIPVKVGNVAEKKILEDAKESLKKRIQDLQGGIDKLKDTAANIRRQHAKSSHPDADDDLKSSLEGVAKEREQMEGQLAKAKAKLSSLNKSEKKVSEAQLKDSILDGITIEELVDTVHSNVEDINKNTVMAQYEELLKMKLDDAKSVISKSMPDILKLLEPKKPRSY
jgi:hypothetical protein